MNKYIPLELIRKHLVLDEGLLEDENNYLLNLADVALQIIENDIDDNIENHLTEDGELVSPLLQGALLVIGNFYNNRESVSYASPKEVPLAYRYIMDQYRKYK